MIKNRFEFIRIYDYSDGYRNPYANIEFVLSKNIFKTLADAWTADDENEFFCETKANDKRDVYMPQNYEQFIKYLQETSISDSIGDVRVVYERLIYGDNDEKMLEPCDLGKDGYKVLLELAEEMFCDENLNRTKKTENHLKRKLACQVNKIHKKMLVDYNEKHGQAQKQ